LPSLDLPPHVALDSATLGAVAARHRLSPGLWRRLPEMGIFNAIYQLGDAVILRVPRRHDAFVAATRRESVAVPAARAAGVRTPRLLAYDDSLDLLPVPYGLYERVPGVTLESLNLDPADAERAWWELGGDLARAHHGVAVAGAVARLDGWVPLPDPREQVERRAAEGWFTSLESRWLLRWLDRLALAALDGVPARFLHGDNQGTNVLVEAAPLRYAAVIDWGAASVGDIALDFAGIPLRAVPAMLKGYETVAVPDGTPTVRERIVWRHLQLALGNVARGAVPGRSWAERPLTMLLEVLSFFADPPDARWRAVGPTC
jgi:aminoglycoside phosphotransferase (APT) family kinase protein